MAEISTPQMEALRTEKDALENRKRLPLPTPPIGFMVNFYRHGNTDERPIPAVICDHGGPGILDLVLFVFDVQTQQSARGVHHKDHPFLISNPQSLKNRGAGTWDYCRGDKAIEIHKEAHIREIDHQIKAIDEHLVRLRVAELKKQQEEKDLAAATAKKSA